MTNRRNFLAALTAPLAVPLLAAAPSGVRQQTVAVKNVLTHEDRLNGWRHATHDALMARRGPTRHNVATTRIIIADEIGRLANTWGLSVQGGPHQEDILIYSDGGRILGISASIRTRDTRDSPTVRTTVNVGYTGPSNTDSPAVAAWRADAVVILQDSLGKWVNDRDKTQRWLKKKVELSVQPWANIEVDIHGTAFDWEDDQLVGVRFEASIREGGWYHRTVRVMAGRVQAGVEADGTPYFYHPNDR